MSSISPYPHTLYKSMNILCENFLCVWKGVERGREEIKWNKTSFLFFCLVFNEDLRVLRVLSFL
jgi:hypothetical protein